MGAEPTSGRNDDRPNQFEDRFVAFVDILGFSEIVKGMQNNPELFMTVRDALATIDEQAERINEYRQLNNARQPPGRVSLLPLAHVTMTAFSDCYLISDIASDEDGEIAPWQLLATVQALGSTLLAKNILTRGAIVRGWAHHDGRVAFGPAIIEAYNIEKNVAKYPRILVSDKVRDSITYNSTVFWNEKLLLRDIDGCWFINVLTPPLSKWTTIAGGPSRLNTTDFLVSIRSFLETKLRASEREIRHLSKIRWLVHHFNRAAEEEGLAIEEGTENIG